MAYNISSPIRSPILSPMSFARLYNNSLHFEVRITLDMGLCLTLERVDFEIYNNRFVIVNMRMRTVMGEYNAG